MFNTAKIQTDGNGNIVAYKVNNSKIVPAVSGNMDFEELKILMQGYRDVQVADGVDADGKTIWTTVRETFEPLVPEPEFTDEELLQQIEDAKPKVVTMRQFRLALLQENLLAIVIDAISVGTDEVLKIEWEYSMEVNRDWASLISLATALGKTSADIDALFLLASTK